MARSISFFCDDLNAGGVQRTVLVLAAAMRDRGWQTEILLVNTDGALLADVPEGVTLTSLGTRGYRRAVRPLAGHLRKTAPDALVAATPWGNNCAVLAARLSGQGTRILTTDVTDPARVYGPEGGWRNRLMAQAARRLYPRAHGRIAVSSGVADAMVDHLGLDRGGIDVIYNPIELARIGPANPPIHPWLSPERDIPVLVAAGRLHPVKDYPTLIEAMAALKARDISVRLVILGEGSERPKLEAMVDRFDLQEMVAMPGFESNVRGAMAAADGYVMCSTAEGLGNALIEAMAEGIPVISTDCPFGPREILADGAYGRLVPVGAPEALADGISGLLEDGPSNLPAEALDRFDITRIVSQYEALLSR